MDQKKKVKIMMLLEGATNLAERFGVRPEDVILGVSTGLNERLDEHFDNEYSNYLVDVGSVMIVRKEDTPTVVVTDDEMFKVEDFEELPNGLSFSILATEKCLPFRVTNEQDDGIRPDLLKYNRDFRGDDFFNTLKKHVSRDMELMPNFSGVKTLVSVSDVEGDNIELGSFALNISHDTEVPLERIGRFGEKVYNSVYKAIESVSPDKEVVVFRELKFKHYFVYKVPA